MILVDRIWPKCYNCGRRHLAMRPSCPNEMGGHHFTWKKPSNDSEGDERSV